MLGIILTVIFTILAAYAVWQYALVPSLTSKARTDNNAIYIIAAAAAAFLLRMAISAAYKGHETDMNCFIGWSNAIFEHGVRQFYTLDMFHDYPPGYMYMLYIVGAINKLFGFSGGAQYAVVKFPAVVCDVIAGILIYKLAKKRFSDSVSAIFASLYLFNPATVLNSSVWGQVDAVYTLFALLMIYFISEKKMIYSYFMFAICLFIKPQAFIFTPVLIGGIIENVFLEDFTKEKFLKNLGFGLGAIALVFLLAVPFGFGNVVEQYKVTLASYPHLSVNAFNIWSAMGQNWGGLTPFASAVSYILLAAISVYSVYIIIKSKSQSKYYFAGALLTFLTYMLSVKMHERYAFPAMALLLMAVVCVPDVKKYAMYVLVTASQIFNSAWALFFYTVDPNKYYRTAPVTIGSVINILLMLFVIYCSYKLYVKGEEAALAAPDTKRIAKAAGNAKKRTSAPQPQKTIGRKEIAVSGMLPKIARADVIAMAVITAVYAGIALYDLGDMEAPDTEYLLTGSPVTVDLGSDYKVSEMSFYLGSYELNDNRAISVAATNSAGEETYTNNITSGSVFCWNEIKDINADIRYLKLSTDSSEQLTIEEFAIKDNNGSLISPASLSVNNAAALFDEQDEVKEKDFRNSTYFDEIYHGRTAYEFIHHLHVYEWTHPPLGKVFIAIGILLFGMCPFGWRIIGTVFGIIMVPIIYLFAKKLLKKTWLAAVTCLLYTFDFMHFAQTRISTIDVYITFFVMLMYFFMYQYYRISFYDTPLKRGLKLLALSGISMGLGIACKWTGIYAGAGLAVLFFITVYRRYEEYRLAVKTPDGETNGISHRFIMESFKPYLIKTLAWCVIFFVIVPAAIYCLAYIPYLKAPDAHGFASIFQNQGAMLTYHSKTVLSSTHPYSSRWYEWIIMKRPIWYFSRTISDGVKEGISAFGNPAVWWTGMIAFFYLVYRIFAKRDKNALFLVIAYLAQLVSWIPVTRLTFIYHYFPCVPFLALMLGYMFKCLYEGSKNKKAAMYAIFAYTAVAIILFAMFYPVLSGHPVSVEYVKNFLKWFDSWVLI